MFLKSISFCLHISYNLTSYDKADISPPIPYPINTLIKITNPNIKATSDTPMMALKSSSCINLIPYLLAFASLLAIALKSFILVCNLSTLPVYVPIGVHISFTNFQFCNLLSTFCLFYCLFCLSTVFYCLFYLPVLPYPPAPRSVSLSVRVSSASTTAIGTMINCAMRSPLNIM